jgi:hypothetical protein
MSAWGKRDRIEVSATARANNGSNTVVTSNQAVTAANGFVVGFSLVIANVDYKIETISSANTIILDTAFRGANVAAANIAIQEDPKWIRTNGWGANALIGRGANTVNKGKVYGLDRVEANIAGNKANGLVGPGWMFYNTYTTTQGATRKKAELLVAMSKNFNANATGTLYGDANDDSIMAES